MARVPRRRPKRSLGQNFLVDPNLRRKIAGAVRAGAGEPVLEIGPGRGALTGHLVDRGVRLTAVELDDELADELARRYEGEPRVRVVHGDVLSLDLPDLGGDWPETTVVGNIPVQHHQSDHLSPAAVAVPARHRADGTGGGGRADPG